MDQSTYSSPEVVRLVNEKFIPVRVDIDKRPDISERYNRGGFPTTAFLSDQGESVWGATYIPPADMVRIMNEVLSAKESGEIDSALERSRMHYLDISKSMEKKRLPDAEFLTTLFEDIFANYDVENGGFGTAPKFPHPDVVDLLLLKLARGKDREVEEAVRETIDKMLKGLYDPVEGGVYRYAVRRDWKEPHYEKMLETNIGLLGNLARASVALDSQKCKDMADGVAGYVLRTLKDTSTGGFFGSQDADEDYYALGETERRKSKPPAVDRTVYAGWNSEAAATFIEAGALLGRKDWISSGLSAYDHSAGRLLDEGRKLIRHTRGQDLFLFDDQVLFLEAIIAAMEIRSDEGSRILAKELVQAVDKWFSSPEGGYNDVPKGGEEIGDLSSPRRGLVSNVRYARALARLGVATQDVDMIQKAWSILLSFPSKTVEAHGLFAAHYVISWWALETEPALVEVHNAPAGDPMSSRLWLAAKRALVPGAVATLAPSSITATLGREDEFAVTCTRRGCSGEISDPTELVSRLKAGPPTQV
jgi:hypothetical protein